MQTMIEGYRSYPGEHCGSVAMRGLLHHYCGLELPENAVFGLGAGLDSVYLSGPGMDPSAMGDFGGMPANRQAARAQQAAARREKRKALKKHKKKGGGKRR